jgi:Leucine-rich repeat (LRR) protein
LDVSAAFLNLEALYVDKNGLAEITGLENLKYLRTLSAREQYVEGLSGSTQGTRALVRHADVRNLYMSANSMPTFDMKHDFLNLQRLELASSGLQSLPSDFGQMAPNLRFLNLNFNALKDLRPLLNIKRLQGLLLAGNRLAQLRKNLAVLSKLTTLTKIDLRDNPLTMGFYAPAIENRLVALKDGLSHNEKLEPFTLPASNRTSDQQYLTTLDEGTRLRRRVHEMMMASNCASLQDLDGLPFDSRDVLVKDEIWERLRHLGIIRKARRCRDDFE